MKAEELKQKLRVKMIIIMFQNQTLRAKEKY